MGGTVLTKTSYKLKSIFRKRRVGGMRNKTILDLRINKIKFFKEKGS